MSGRPEVIHACCQLAVHLLWTFVFTCISLPAIKVSPADPIEIRKALSEDQEV